MHLSDLPWPEHLPCARETATVVVRSQYGERLGWADLTRADTCGRDTPSACSEGLRAALDEQGMLSCRDIACVWTFPASDFDAALVWLERPAGVPALTATLMCAEDPATGVRWDLGGWPAIEETVWRLSGAEANDIGARAALNRTPDGRTVVGKVALAPDVRLADPEALPGEKLAWKAIRARDLGAALAARDALAWSRAVPTVACNVEGWIARWPDDEDGVLLRVRQTVGADCDTATETQEWLLRVDAAQHPNQAVDWWTMRNGRQRHPIEAVRLPDGDWGLRGEVVTLPDPHNRCERRGRYVMALTEPHPVLMADTTPASCPAETR